jgi:hypothetical protein
MAASGERVSYGELGLTARRGAQALRAAGLRPGDGIAVLTENRIESLPLYWAAQLAGLTRRSASVPRRRSELHPRGSTPCVRHCDAARTAAHLVPQPTRFVLGADAQSVLTDAIDGAPTRHRRCREGAGCLLVRHHGPERAFATRRQARLWVRFPSSSDAASRCTA